ncbi:MAG: metalloprotease TldD [Candidatus Eremiobacteraeota bacterium]|nr:metalloprotease TldD [Candidatus Eremiobacteraeota bacterium]MBV8372099.1 metalloprotease TldD [Candidatus Eremiobacteraeota bacterium]
MRLISRALRRGGDFADVFCERRNAQSFRLQDGRIHEAVCGVTLGVGIRVVAGESAGYAFSDDLSFEALVQAADAASLIARGANAASASVDLSVHDVPAWYEDGAGERSEPAQYVALLERADIAARAYDARVVAVNAHVAQELQEVWIANSDGRFVHDRRPMVTLGVQVVATDAKERGSGFAGDGGRTSIAYFDGCPPEALAADAARIAVVNVSAIPAPAGEMTMIVGAGGGGVLLHEAVGHGLESDFNRRGTSLYSGRVGQRVASELVTIYDDGNLPQERGSLNVDDEGVAGQHKVLVENGVLRGYMQDLLNAHLMGVQSTGSGRRQSFRFLPQPRMCNTYMPSGTSSVDEILASTKRGIYAKSFAGGQVEISKGDFVFMVGEGYLVEDGKITTPLKNATIVGNGPDAMTKVTAVADDSRLARRHYTCGKGGQFVPVGVGMPTIKIASITVGGSSVDG